MFVQMYVQFLNMNNIAISNARSELPSLVKKVDQALQRFAITVNGQVKAVLISQEELESLEETAEVLSIPGAKNSIKIGMKQAKKKQGLKLKDL